MLLILGLDGASLDLAEPWMDEGVLPNLAALARRGTFGRLASTIPPATFPSWTSFMTGVNPGRHAIFDFSRRDPGTYTVRFVNSTYRKAATVWQHLSEGGRRVAVLGVPGTYPPEPVNGLLLSGFDTPVTTRADRSFAYPREFGREVERLGGFPFADFQEFDVGPGWHEDALARLLAGIEQKVRLAEHVIGRGPWDCLMLLFGESDTVAHHFWAFHDEKSPRRAAGHTRLGDPIRTVYAALDAAVGRIAAMAAPDRILIASDHGFGGAGDTAVYLNRWLEREGYLSWEAARAPGLAARARAAAVRFIPQRLQARCFRLGGGRLAGALESRVRFGGIDWRRTAAFSEELNYFPSIWLNVAGRDPLGRVPAGEYERVRGELKERLLAWRDPYGGEPVVCRAWCREEIYHGPHVEMAPDLVLQLNTPGGYSYVCLPSGGAGGDPVAKLDGAALGGGKLRGMSGSHRPDGLFVVAGDGVAPGRFDRAHIADLAPTVLALCGAPVPAGLDGRCLPCVASGAGVVRDPGPRAPAEAPYDESEERSLRTKLERLGYLE